MPRTNDRDARGYGSPHVKARAALLPSAVGSACTRCGVTLTSEDKIHLDHTDDRSAYAGFAHAKCNQSAGAIKGNRARGIGPLGHRSRLW